MRLRLLGPMGLRVDGRDVPLGPARQRTVLAALAVDAGRPVPVDLIVDRVWGDEPPGKVRTVIHSYVTRLRGVLHPAGVARRGGGYALDVDPEAVDLILFDRLIRTARSGPAFDLDAAAQALALWHGPALADLSGDWVAGVRQRAEQRRVEAAVDWARSLVADRPAEVIAGLRDLAAQHPLVEPLAALLVEALHRDGRDAEALDLYAGVRRHLIEELGTEPGTALRSLHRAVLAGTGPPDTLPADTGAFTGREAETARLTAAATGGNVLVVHAIAGMPGIGKTALAVHVAHRVRGDFPDAQVFVNLHGHTAGREPSDPADVLATLLTADGVDPRRLPAGVEARSALWRSRLSGRRALLVLDNALDSSQVAPLLPASPGCLVLVTSRRHLGDLPADTVPVPLDVLPAGEAERMFRRLAPHADGPEVAALVAACGHLPLAVSLLARVLSRHRGWTVADLLQETRSRLLHVTAEHASIAAAFDLSYQHLPATRQRFFRLLAAHPGTEIEPYAAAALAGIPAAEAVGLLDALHADSLLIEIGRHRYTMHDLIRAYARTLPGRVPPDRLLDFYAAAAAAANAEAGRLTRPGTAPATGAELPSFPDAERAMAWLRAERANLLACLASTTESRRIVALTAGLSELLRRDGPWSRAVALHEEAVAAAIGDRGEHANALLDLATVRRLGGDYPGAQRDARAALEIYRGLGERLGEANALTGMAKALSRASGYTDAERVLQRALDLYRELGDRPGEAGALVEAAVAVGMTSDFRGALELLRRALTLYRRLGDRPGEAYALRLLGISHGRVGDFAGSRELLTEALDGYRALGARLGVALTRTDLGRATAGLGDYPAAIATLRAALREHRTGDHLVGQSVALLYLGGALRRAGDLAGAAEVLHEALALDREIHNRSGQAMVLNELGAVHRLAGDVDRAVAAHREALELSDLVPSPWDRAQSLAGFGRCAVARGRRREGSAALRTALGIFREIDAAEAGEVASELETLKLGPLKNPSSARAHAAPHG